MSKLNLQNEELDRIGRKLLADGRLKSAEIDLIVSSPQLFSRVKTKIESEQQRQISKNSFNFREFLQFQHRAAISAALLLVLLIGGAISRSKSGKFNQSSLDEQTSLPEIRPTSKSSELAPPDAPSTSDKSAKVIKTIYSPAASAKINRINITTVKTLKVPARTAREQNPQQKFNRELKKSEGEFYAVGFAGNIIEPAEEMHIVRTELSRSSLFALGVNLSLENETEKIKTDLLVGADGVARAIRFVN